MGIAMTMLGKVINIRGNCFFTEDLHEASKAHNQELESENARLQGEPVVSTLWTAVFDTYCS